MKSARSRAFAVALGVAATAAGLELGARLIARSRGAPFSAEASRASIENASRQLALGAFVPGWPRETGGTADSQASMKLQPYTGFQHSQTEARIQADLAYYRTPEAQSTFDICVLGGSVAYLFGTVGRKALVAALEADPRLQGREVRIHDYALGGYKEPQQLMLFLWLVELGEAPDAVLNLDGANEAALGRSNYDGGAHPAYPYLPRWTNVTLRTRSDGRTLDGLHDVRASHEEARQFAESFLASGLWRSAFLERIGILRLQALRTRYSSAYRDLLATLRSRPREPEISGPRVPGGEGGFAQAIVTCWEESSVALRGACEAHGVAYLHVLQPTLYDQGSKPLTQKEIDGAKAEAGWTEGVPKLYPALREAGARLVERGVSFFDASGVFRGHSEDLYRDMCHFDERGNEILAKAIAPELLAAKDRAEAMRPASR